MTFKREVVLDFETASAVDLPEAGAWRYAEDPTTEILSLTYTWRENGGPWQKVPFLWVPAMLLYPLLLELVNDPETLFVAHNAGFEKAIWRRIMVEIFGYPDIPNSRWHDTMAMCAMRVVPQDLDRALTVLRLPHSKDKEGSKLTISLSKPRKDGSYDRSPATLAKVYEYNASDIYGEVGLHDRLGHLPPGERQIWLLDQRINERGVLIDLDFVSAALAVVARASGPLLMEFAELTDGLRPTQVAKVLAWCHGNGVHLDNLKAETLKEVLGDEEELESFAGDDIQDAFVGNLPANVYRVLFIRKLIGSASIGKLARMQKCVCADGRARGLLQYHGTGPGLWAGRLFQPQNFPRGTVQIAGKGGKKKAPDPELSVRLIKSRDPALIQMSLGEPVEVVVSSLRHAIVAAPGKRIVSGDYSGIQARIILALSGQHDKCKLMADGKDVYIDMAEDIFKVPHGTYNKEEHVEQRQIGKNSVLGLGFQMGARKFRVRYAKEHPLSFAEGVVHAYRKVWAPKVPYLWYGLQDAATAAVWERKPQEAFGIEYRMVDNWLTARLPSGRRLWYYNPVAIRKAMPWDELDVRPAWQYNALKMGQWRTIDAFGGLLAENVDMGMQRDLMTTAMFKCERAGLPVILNVHDEIITEPDVACADEKALDAIMCDVPEWCRHLQIPIAVGTWSGDRYKK